MGYSKGTFKGAKGCKGKPWTWRGDDAWSKGKSDAPDYWKEPTAESDKYKARLQAQFAFPKAALRAYAADDGSCLYAEDTKAFLSKEGLGKHLTADNAYSIRHPATGISVAASSLKSGAATLEEVAGDPTLFPRTGIPQLALLFQSDEGKEFLKHLQTLCYSDGKTVPKDDRTAALRSIRDFIETNEAHLFECAGRCALATSRLYVSAMALLELLSAFSDPAAWASKIPGDSKALAKWQKHGDSLDHMIKALNGFFAEKEKQNALYKGGGNAASSLFGAWGAPAAEDEEETSDDMLTSSTSSSDKKKDKKNKKNKKKSKSKSDKAKMSSKKKDAKKKNKDRKSKNEKDEKSESDDDETKKTAGGKKKDTGKKDKEKKAKASSGGAASSSVKAKKRKASTSSASSSSAKSREGWARRQRSGSCCSISHRGR